MKRLWRDIPGLEGRYQVSNDGYVRSLPDIDPRGRFMPGHVLKAAHPDDGYPRVLLAGKTRKVHILVAQAFIPNPNGLPEVNHKDGDKGHAHVDNLEWCTRSENHLHRYRVLGQVGGMTGKRGIKCANSKPVAACWVSTGAHVGFFGSASEAARELSIEQSGISMCARGDLRSYKGMRWVYVTREQFAEVTAGA